MLMIPRRWRRRPPFSVALVGLVVGLTALTAVTMGALAWHEQRSRSRTILDATMNRTAQLAASHADRLLRDAEAVARVGPQLVAEGQLDTDDTAALERFTLAVLRAHPELSWVSYGGADDRFVGAWRDGASSFEFEHGRERYLGRGVPLMAGALSWVVEMLVPERDYTEHADAQARVTIVLGIVALGLALAGGIVVVRWIAQPLRALAWEAGRIRQGHLDVTLLPRSRDELGVLTRAMIDMARTLRDRDFIRETLGRYVSPSSPSSVSVTAGRSGSAGSCGA